LLLANATQTFGGGSGVNIVMPRLMAAFGANLATAQWVVTGFFLTRILVMPLLGWLACWGIALCLSRSWRGWW
jgi:MFS family permease